MKRFFAAALAAVVLPASAQAALVINVAQVGTSVIFTGSGSFNTAGLTQYSPSQPFQSSPGVNPSYSLNVGVSAPISIFTGLTGKALGTFANFTSASAATGDAFGLNYGLNGINVPVNYISGTQLAGTATFLNQTIAGLHLTAGSYVFSSSSANDTLTINVGPLAAVPEPATWAMMVGGFGLLGAAMRRRKVGVRFA
ncbi:PEPxxWA-CTERM sorting domain-containing protein [Sphingomonas sp. BIUV-7]|uniref:PEPxxWA-CTERM sorting domain-containing protein n=1 Tax=Sphingomonas natans TaxID=3063330 RepID=A0ABT8YDR0_9SPHN|nr:PEPxxWA-CTERM sorting domain-containing protein [Sphingomonas sp. BIUV-7]MDO6416477.1 PEPxxWA-CTERM sorting domain-containing protein [Sphingomonas sp. BIUV-7]